MIMKVSDIELIVTYDIGLVKIELSQDTILKESCIRFSILDVEQDRRSGRTTVEFSDCNEIRKVISDFEKRFNLIKKNNL
jgi:hypothetical protein